MSRQLRPSSFEAAALALSGAAAGAERVRIRGAGTKRAWGAAAPTADVDLHTSALDQVVEHNAGDLTAVLQAGAPLARAQRRFARAGQMLAIDPWLGHRQEATVGGVLATADSGPLRHRYGAPRDLIVGMTVALSDGTIARSGGKVIKNVAGYDLAKLFCGSFGTLGLILEVNVRLHPLPYATVTAVGVSGDPATLAAAARGLSAAPLELEALDVAWRTGRGGLLAQCGGAAAPQRGERVAEWMRQAGLQDVETVVDDAELWARQRVGQRAPDGAMMRISARPSILEAVLAASDRASGTLVGRVGLGLSFVAVEPEAVSGLLSELPAGAVAMLLDGPDELRRDLEVWGAAPAPEVLELMRRVKARFDPAQVCNPGMYVGGI